MSDSAGVDAPGYSRVREIAERTFQHTSGAKSFRHVGKDLGAAFPADSDYPDHCRSRLDVPRWYSVKFCHALCLEHGNEMAQLVFDIAWCRNSVSNFLA